MRGSFHAMGLEIDEQCAVASRLAGLAGMSPMAL